MIFLILLIFSSNLHASLHIIPPSKRYAQKIKKNKVKPIKSKPTKLQQNESKIEELLGRYTQGPDIYDGTAQIKVATGTTLQGTLLNSVVSTNLESPLLVSLDSNSMFPQGSKLSCEGVTKHHRIVAACNLLMTPDRELEVNTVLLNLDGSLGLRGEVYDPKEIYIASSVATSFAKGAISASQDRIANLYGEITPSTLKNRTLQGLLESANSATDLMKEEVKNQEVTVSVDAGTRVLIYFKKGVNQ